MDGRYHIVMAADDNYAQHLGVCLVSLFVNNRTLSFCAHIFESGMSEINQRKIEEVAKQYQQTVLFHTMSINDFVGFPLSDAAQSYYSTATLFRLRLGEMLDHSISRVLYLDSDTIVCGPITDLLMVDLNGCALAAVMDSPWQLEFAEEHIGIKKDIGYFNSGVMVIDMTQYRMADVWNKSIELIKQGRKLPFLDQDILNILFTGQWKEIPCKWNVLNGFLKRQYQDGSSRAKEIVEGIQNRVIIHYSAKEKPWMWRCENPLKAEYFKYLRMSPWKDYRMSLSLYEKLVFVKRYFKSLLRPTYIRVH